MMATWDGDLSEAARRQGGSGAGNYRQTAYTTPTDWQIYAARQAAATSYQRPQQEEPMRERTQEEIIAECEARVAQLEREAERIKECERLAAQAARVACSKCRWVRKWSKGYPDLAVCHNPLIKGFGEAPHCYDSRYNNYWQVKLCGQEKALWEPKLRWWERLLEWLEEKCN